MKRLILLLLVAPAWADDGHGHDHGGGDVDIDSAVAVDAGSVVSTSVHDSSRALGLGLGDVDINDCYRSYQVLIWQDSKANRWCMANDLDARGLHEAAARLRCSVRAYATNFGGKDECIRLSTMTLPVAVQAVSEPEIDEDEEEFHVEQQMLYEDLRAKIRNLESAVNKPKVVTRVEQRGLTDEQKAALRETVK